VCVLLHISPHISALFHLTAGQERALVMAAADAKIKVGVIYSDNDTSSYESIFLAKYIGAHLAGTGWSTVSLIGFRPGDCSNGLPNDRISYYPNGASKPTEAAVCILINFCANL
jgi:hypothetical protein